MTMPLVCKYARRPRSTHGHCFVQLDQAHLRSRLQKHVTLATPCSARQEGLHALVMNVVLMEQHALQQASVSMTARKARHRIARDPALVRNHRRDRRHLLKRVTLVTVCSAPAEAIFSVRATHAVLTARPAHRPEVASMDAHMVRPLIAQEARCWWFFEFRHAFA